MNAPIGFSTGAVALADFRGALDSMRRYDVDAVELSALRVSELAPLVEALPTLDLARYRHISFHAPSHYSPDEESDVLDACHHFIRRGWPIVLHPDAIRRWDRWNALGRFLFIENMDKRKRTGRTADELSEIFSRLPESRLCFDVAHARQYDASMTEAYRILNAFGDRIGQVHISEVGSRSTHERISEYAALAFRQVARLIPREVPVIIESRVGPDQMASEIEAARAALRPLELRQTA